MKKVFLVVASGIFVSMLTLSATSCSSGDGKTPVADSLLIGEWIIDGTEAANKVTLKLDTARHAASLHFAHTNSEEGGRYDNYLRGEWAVQGADSLKLDFSEGRGNWSTSGWKTDAGKEKLAELANESQESVKKENGKVSFITDLQVSGDTLTGKLTIDGNAVTVLYVRDK